MKTALIATLALLSLAACGERQVLLPDGGHERINCNPNEAVFMTVKVVDAAGTPVEGATVTATNQGLNRQATAQTNGQGVTNAIGEDIGGGTVSIRATLGTRVSEIKQVEWTCGECHCNVNPASITVTLSP
jgi:hypothetical protein